MRTLLLVFLLAGDAYGALPEKTYDVVPVAAPCVAAAFARPTRAIWVAGKPALY